MNRSYWPKSLEILMGISKKPPNTIAIPQAQLFWSLPRTMGRMCAIKLAASQHCLTFFLVTNIKISMSLKVQYTTDVAKQIKQEASIFSQLSPFLTVLGLTRPKLFTPFLMTENLFFCHICGFLLISSDFCSFGVS